VSFLEIKYLIWRRYLISQRLKFGIGSIENMGGKDFPKQIGV